MSKIRFMSDTPNKNYFTTGQMRNALIQIEDQMVHSNWMPNIILGINRGGCIPGVYLSHRLNTVHEVLDIRLRDHTSKPNLTTLEKAFAFQKKILIKFFKIIFIFLNNLISFKL